MKLSKTLAFAAAAVGLLSTAAVYADAYTCNSMCSQAAANVYNQVMQYYPGPAEQVCASVPSAYYADCAASVNAARTKIQADALNASSQAYSQCMSTCH